LETEASGTGYEVLHSFLGGSGDGSQPEGSLTLSADGTTLYGLPTYGGSSGDGVVFALTLPWDTGFQDLGSGWHWLAWFGDYTYVGANWIWQPTFGYEYVWPASTPSNIFFYDSAGLGWLWTSSTTYPYLYCFSESAWLWYEQGTSSPRWFNNLTAGRWEQH